MLFIGVIERNSNWRRQWNSNSCANVPSWLNYHTAVSKHKRFCFVFCFIYFFSFCTIFISKANWLTCHFLFWFLIVFSKISWGFCGWLIAVFLTWCLFPSCLWSDFVGPLIKAGFHFASTFYPLIVAKNGWLHLSGNFILPDHRQLLWLEVKESSDWHYVVLIWCIIYSLRP